MGADQFCDLVLVGKAGFIDVLPSFECSKLLLRSGNVFKRHFEGATLDKEKPWVERVFHWDSLAVEHLAFFEVIGNEAVGNRS